MSTHLAPHSYMLKDFVEIEPLPSVSWWPETLGWKLLTIIICLVITIYLAKYLHYRWQNRYRREALVALIQAKQLPREQQATRLFFILKTVLSYVTPSMGKVTESEFLQALDQALPKQKKCFNQALGQQWQASVYSSSQGLNAEQLEQLYLLTEQWLQLHQGPRAIKFADIWQMLRSHNVQ